MNSILINKIKKALKTEHPIESINEIVSEYEEIRRLSEWRNKILLSGNSLKKNEKELNRIAELVSSSEYFSPFCGDECFFDMFKYFSNLRKK